MRNAMSGEDEGLRKMGGRRRKEINVEQQNNTTRVENKNITTRKYSKR